MEDVRKTKVPKRISEIEAAECHRKGRDAFVSMVEEGMHSEQLTYGKQVLLCL